MRVGFIGLGNIGGPSALNILRARDRTGAPGRSGHELTVHDLRHELAEPHLERGARWADSPREVAAASEVVFTSLPGPPEVRAVAVGEGGLIEGLAPGSTWVDLSSSSPTLIRELHARFAERGVEVLDAPVSGGPRAALEGTQALMVGGDEARYEQLRPLLELMGDKVSRVGDVGAGSVAKLVHNLIAQCSRAAAVEGLLLGVKVGLDPLVLYRVLQDGAFGQNFFLKQSLPHHILAGQFETPRGGQGRARKDIALATGLARDLGVPMPIASMVEQLQIEAVRRGWSERNASAYVQLQEARAGVELRAEVSEGG